MPGWQPTDHSRAQLEERRLVALAWIVRGTHRNREIAHHFGVSVHTVYTWKARLRRNGGRQATVASGVTSRLTAAQHEPLRTWLRMGPYWRLARMKHGWREPPIESPESWSKFRRGANPDIRNTDVACGSWINSNRFVTSSCLRNKWDIKSMGSGIRFELDFEWLKGFKS